MDPALERDFTDFVRHRAHSLLRIAHALTGERRAAEDLLQSALARVAARWSHVRGDPEAYVRRCLYHQYISVWRYRRRRPEVPLATMPDRPDGADPAETVAVRMQIEAVLAMLPRRQRAVIVLRYLEDLSERQVADILGCSTGTVASQASRALARIRAAIAPTGGAQLKEIHG